MSEQVYCTVDVGGTKILLLLIDGDKNVLHRERFSTPAEVSPEEMVRVISRSAAAALIQKGFAADKITGLGVCIAALVDYERGLLHQAPNLGWYGPVHFQELLQQNWLCPVYLDNDANAAVMGEVSFGSARGHRDVIYITISTGIGGGLYLDGKVFRGSNGFAGEVGHIKPFGSGRRCRCGGMDCLETWASGEAIARNAKTLWEDLDPEHGPINTAWVFEQARAGNPLARSIIDQALQAISTGLANLVTLLNPSCLVIGGGVIAGRDDFLAQIRDRVQQIAIAPAVSASPLEITAAQLESEAGVWGMYSFMLEEQKQNE
jgi:glucokinase